MNKKKVYLACPYSHEDEKVRKQRFKLANKWAGKLMGDYIVFSPLSHSVPIAHNGRKNYLDHEFWMNQYLPFIGWCDEIHILCLPGWDKSRGIQEEVHIAQILGKPVYHITNLHRGQTGAP